MTTIVLVAVLSVSGVTVQIVERQSGKPIEGAVFILTDSAPNGSTLPELHSDAKGNVNVINAPPRGNASVSADGYETSVKSWPIQTVPRKIRMIVQADELAYVVPSQECVRFKPVYETMTRADGTQYTVARTVVEYYDCSGVGVPLRFPTTPPPPGYAYRLARVEKWYDADRDMVGHRPYYYLVPVSQFVAPCGCQ